MSFVVRTQYSRAYFDATSLILAVHSIHANRALPGATIERESDGAVLAVLEECEECGHWWRITDAGFEMVLEAA